MKRAWYLAGWGYVAIAAMIVYRGLQPGYVGTTLVNPPEWPVEGYTSSDSYSWFQAVRPHCNALEVELQMRSSPPPAGWEGAGYAASCWAVAGRIDRARESIDALPAGERSSAAGVVFGVGHPIADSGDDRSAGPIMQLVVAYQPDNYMALYHAGMSYYAIGQPDLARRHLTEFNRQYTIEDGWLSNSREILKRIGAAGGR